MKRSELIGHIGTVVILASLMMTDMLWLRWVNLVGALISILYGRLINQKPLWLLNSGVAMIDIYQLLLLYKIL